MHCSIPDTRIILVIALFLIVIKGHAQQANFKADNTAGCAPLTVSFQDESTGTNASSTRVWNFGNGNTANNDLNPEAVYTQPGTYTVTLTVSNGGSGDTETKNAYITVYEKPSPDFSFTPASGCAPLNVAFTDLSTPGSGTLTGWQWVFGDGGSSHEQNPTYRYDNTQTYSVTLIATNQFGCEQAVVKSAAINVAGPTASFTSSEDNFCTFPALVDFQNTSTGAEQLTYLWDFGDGSTSTSKNASHTFNASGNFTVTLKVTTSNNCSDVYSSVIAIGGEGGVDFTPSATKICINGNVSFFEVINGIKLSQEWNFGDGSPVHVGSNPTHQFTTAGTFSVTMTVQLAGKDCPSVVTRKIEVLNFPVPAYSYSSVNCSREIRFSNVSTGGDSWLWNFGDGITSTEKNPSHLFSLVGVYFVKLQVSNAAGCVVSTEKVVNVASPPRAAFVPNLEQHCTDPSLSGCAPFTPDLKDHSTGGTSPIVSWAWDFGDGVTSTDQHPVHTYPVQGNFTLTLKVTNQNGCTDIETRLVTVSDVTPTAKFTIADNEVCNGEEVEFSAAESLNTDFFCWDFGDGTTGAGKTIKHRYSNAGLYTVALKVKNGGCEDIAIVTNAVKVNEPSVSFKTVKNCADPFKVTFENLSTGYDAFEWDLGDGTKDSESMQPTRSFPSPGLYTVSLTATNAGTGCTITQSQFILIQKVQANFTVSESKPCLGEEITITDASQSAAGWLWSFGDGTPGSMLASPKKTYNTPGTYDLNLVVRDSDGCESATTLPIEVLDLRGDFAFSSTSNCDALMVDFEDRSQGNLAVTGWIWDFGDGNTGTGPDVHHDYQEEGSYSVKLTLQTNGGKNCSVVKTDVIEFVTPIPDFELAKPGYCVGQQVTVYNTSHNASSYEWEFSNGESSTDQHPSTTFAAPGRYSVKLTAIDGSGCRNSIEKADYISITKPQASFEASDTFAECPPLVTSFQDRSQFGRSWKWDFGDGQTSSLTNPVNTYQRPGNFDVRLIVTDVNGCTDSTTLNQVVNVGGPDGVISVEPLSVCVGVPVIFQASSTNTAIHRWDFGDGQVVDLPENTTVHEYTHGGNATVSAVFIDGNGCQVAAPVSYTISVLDIPTVSFHYAPKYPFEGEEIAFTGISTGAGTLAWSHDQGVFSDQPGATISFENAGLKSITFSARNAEGCTADTTQQVLVQANIEDIPNVFTPNNDKYNNTFAIPGVEEGLWILSVYNRWGISIFESKNYQGLWSANGVSNGVYYYTLQNMVRRDKFYKGHVTILK